MRSTRSMESRLQEVLCRPRNPTMRTTWIALIAAASLLAVARLSFAQGQPDPLADGFKNPPDSAKPRTWWHWTGGNVTKGGITKDLEWMKRVGIAGMQLADVRSGGGQT